MAQKLIDRFLHHSVVYLVGFQYHRGAIIEKIGLYHDDITEKIHF